MCFFQYFFNFLIYLYTEEIRTSLDVFHNMIPDILHYHVFWVIFNWIFVILTRNFPIPATISVLPWLQVNTIQTYSEVLQSKMLSNEETWKDSNFIMLQLVNALKTLQAQGIEELPMSLNSFVLCKDMDKDGSHRLCVLQG